MITKPRTGTVVYVPAKPGAPGHYKARYTADDGSRPWIPLDPGPKSPQAEERARDWIAGKIERGELTGIVLPPKVTASERSEMEPHVRWVQVTPTMAQTMLEVSAPMFRNRPLQLRHVQLLARVIRQGGWNPRLAVLQMTASGRVLNGQHRLSAIAASGITCLVGIIDDCKESDAAGMDQNTRGRSYADMLAMAGMKNAQLIASTSRFIIHLHRRREDLGVTTHDLNKARETFQESIGYVINMANSCSNSIRQAAVLASFALTHDIAPEPTDDLLKQLVTCVGRTERGAANAIAKAVERHRFNEGSPTRFALALKVLRGIQLHTLRRSVVRLEPTDEGLNWALKERMRMGITPEWAEAKVNDDDFW